MEPSSNHALYGWRAPELAWSCFSFWCVFRGDLEHETAFFVIVPWHHMLWSRKNKIDLFGYDGWLEESFLWFKHFIRTLKQSWKKGLKNARTECGMGWSWSSFYSNFEVIWSMSKICSLNRYTFFCFVFAVFMHGTLKIKYWWKCMKFGLFIQIVVELNKPMSTNLLISGFPRLSYL